MYKDQIDDYEIRIEKHTDCERYKIVVYRGQTKLMQTFCIYKTEEAAVKDIEGVKETLYRKVINRDSTLNAVKDKLKSNNFEVKSETENFYIIRKGDAEHRVNENSILSKEYIKKLIEIWGSVVEYAKSNIIGIYAKEIFYSDIENMIKDFKPRYKNIVYGLLVDTLRRNGYRIYT